MMLRQPTICETETKWLAAAASLAIGEYLGFCCQRFYAAWPFLAVLAVLCALFGFGYTLRGWRCATIGLIGFSLSLAIVDSRYKVIHNAHIEASGQPYTAVFTLRSDPVLKRTRKGDVVAEFPGEIGFLRVKVIANVPPGTAPPKSGETWQCSGWLSDWNEHDTLQRKKFWIRGKSSSLTRIDSSWRRFSSERTLEALRNETARRLGLGLRTGSHPHKLLCAMLLGERNLLDATDKKTFVDAGAMHVFAISGLHVMVLVKIFVFLGVMTMIPLRFAGAVAIPLAWLYVAMVGSPPSAVRAATMASICLVAPMFWRQPDGIVAWAMAFIASHLANPAQIVDAGSGLSFVIMLALVILLRLGGEGIKRPVIGTLIFSCAAWAAALPISIRVFGRIALSGLISGPLVVPTAMCATICGALGILTSFISERLAAYPNACAGLIMRLMFAVCSLISKIPYANIELAKWSIGECLAWYAALAAFLWLCLTINTRRSSVI